MMFMSVGGYLTKKRTVSWMIQSSEGEEKMRTPIDEKIGDDCSDTDSLVDGVVDDHSEKCRSRIR